MLEERRSPKPEAAGSSPVNGSMRRAARTPPCPVRKENRDKPVLPIESQTVEQLVTASITTVAALVAWWKNNSFPPAALQADQTYDKLKAQGK